jgi:hypothetical protein
MLMIMYHITRDILRTRQIFTYPCAKASDPLFSSILQGHKSKSVLDSRPTVDAARWSQHPALPHPARQCERSPVCVPQEA